MGVGCDVMFLRVERVYLFGGYVVEYGDVRWVEGSECVVGVVVRCVWF